ncbi:hypothetical protein VNO77_22565 [Canavalia gladiata]|uniref:Uncharacterized protein n=1 Tax=Canavalia gladiata TaxID=3824 RepID=A0AAN9QEK5_CANGL
MPCMYGRSSRVFVLMCDVHLECTLMLGLISIIRIPDLLEFGPSATLSFGSERACSMVKTHKLVSCCGDISNQLYPNWNQCNDHLFSQKLSLGALSLDNTSIFCLLTIDRSLFPCEFKDSLADVEDMMRSTSHASEHTRNASRVFSQDRPLY